MEFASQSEDTLMSHRMAAIHNRRYANIFWVAVLMMLLSGSVFTPAEAAIRLPKITEKYEFYVQVVRSDFTFSNSTAVRIWGKGAPDPSPPFAFGDAVVFDDKITKGPDFFSQELGRIHGVFFDACYNSTGCLKLLVVATLDFTAGKLIGTIPITFLEDLTIPVRTYSFSGGTGDFILTQGFGVVTPTVLADGYLRSHTVLRINRQFTTQSAF
ncbi:hypothetical protein O6H91_22G004700 [Diphasiastrum complanatum]|uniref:Uncharacterized protein n=1 Tax=Diphasiastrum complanatum TaxID=34168 RepID=A0ACC2ADL0_DIPCM|nr:hypothetical protein O6H91_22G004700 [Diphasiastrum complanatum]